MNKAQFSFWRTRAIGVTLVAAFTLAHYFAPASPENGHPLEFWYVAFYVCWAVSCWPQVLDKQFGNYCAAHRSERKHLPRTASYWIANLAATAAVSILIAEGILILLRHLR